jgi:hypothetical protein
MGRGHTIYSTNRSKSGTIPLYLSRPSMPPQFAFIGYILSRSAGKPVSIHQLFDLFGFESHYSYLKHEPTDLVSTKI